MEPYLQALLRELDWWRKFISSRHITSIYFGGGTPSLLPANKIAQILDHIARWFLLAATCEITVECNPEDITPEWLGEVRAAGVNRLSIGVQSFNNGELHLLGRHHTPQQAYRAVALALNTIENVSVDLIYGLPIQREQHILQTLNTVRQLGVPHFSAYMLTLEKHTLLWNLARKGKLPINEEKQAVLFYTLQEWAHIHGYQQYEISNFALNESYHSRHNLTYWQMGEWVGVGAGAWSAWWMGGCRLHRQNIASIRQYIEHAGKDTLPVRKELLQSPEALLDELVVCSLRLKSGISREKLANTPLAPLWNALWLGAGQLTAREPFSRWLSCSSERVMLTKEGMLWCDRVALELVTETSRHLHPYNIKEKRWTRAGKTLP